MTTTFATFFQRVRIELLSRSPITNTGLFVMCVSARQRMERHRRIRRYLAATRSPKLHLGAGANRLPGWLNTDKRPRTRDVVLLDAGRRLPFGDQVFAHVYSEHMIEHLSWPTAGRLLRECFRILKRGGKIRIATPDLSVLVGLYRQPGHGQNRTYINWIRERWLDCSESCARTFVLNNAFRNWGHAFLYDEQTLSMALVEAGFRGVTRCGYGESLDPELRRIESHGIAAGDEAMVAFETMVLEAERPEWESGSESND